MDEYYTGLTYTCSPGCQNAQIITVGPNENITGIDFDIDIGGKISGVVTNSNSNPVQGVRLDVYNFDTDRHISSDFTSADGSYTLTRIPTGNYRIWISSSGYYLDEYFKNAGDSESATPIAVVEGNTTTGIDITLTIGGMISGRITKDTDGEPLKSVRVKVYDSTSGDYLADDYTDSDGNYTIRDVPTGKYKIEAIVAGYLGVFYYNAKDSESASLVSVEAGVTTGIDFKLSTGGIITGTAIDKITSNPIEGVSISVYDKSGSEIASTSTESNGTYAISGLPTDDYIIQAYSTGYYISEYYDDVSDSGSATSITVTEGNTTTGIDFELTTGGKITGTVIDKTSTDPIGGEWVYVYDDSRLLIAIEPTSSWDGTYTIPALSADKYKIRVRPNGYLGEYYNDAEDWDSATFVSVEPSVTVEINFRLSTGGIITGIISDETTEGPVAGARVAIYHRTGQYINATYTDSDGAYTISGLQTDNYILRVFNSGDYFGEYYNKAKDFKSATLVSVESDVMTEINFGLIVGGTISGTIQSDSDSGPIKGINVYVYDFESGNYIGRDRSDAYGNYSIYVPSGEYRVQASSSGEYLGEYYENAEDRDSATSVTVESEMTTDIDFSLAKSSGKSITSLVANYQFNGDPSDSTGISSPFELINTEFINNTLYLNGIYESAPNGFKTFATIDDFKYQYFTISMDFYPFESSYYMPIIVGGEWYRWFNFECSGGSGDCSISFNT